MLGDLGPPLQYPETALEPFLGVGRPGQHSQPDTMDWVGRNNNNDGWVKGCMEVMRFLHTVHGNLGGEGEGGGWKTYTYGLGGSLITTRSPLPSPNTKQVRHVRGEALQKGEEKTEMIMKVSFSQRKEGRKGWLMFHLLLSLTTFESRPCVYVFLGYGRSLNGSRACPKKWEGSCSKRRRGHRRTTRQR